MTKRGNSHILAIIESFTGHIRLYPMGDLDSKSVADALHNYVCNHSMPLKIITDNGPEFANEVMAELTKRMGLQH